MSDTVLFGFFLLNSLSCLVLEDCNFEILLEYGDLIQYLFLHLIILFLQFLPSLSNASAIRRLSINVTI